MKFLTNLNQKANEKVHIAPLVVFRIVFGLMMFGATIRFWANGWIQSLYVDPDFYFPYLGLEWIKPLGSTGMHLIFFVIGISALFIALGLFFRISALTFSLCFTYVELIDKTPYLNHYYFICIVSFLLFLMPAHRYFSLDVFFKIAKPVTHVQQIFPFTIKLQLACVYFFAGIAKIHPDWMFEALPLKIWLPAREDMPVLGPLFAQEWTAYVFSWIGLLFDLFIPFILFNSRFRWVGYIVVVVFHVLTWMLFNIGMFPFVMIGSTLIFFSEGFHMKVIERIRIIFRIKPAYLQQNALRAGFLFRSFIIIYFFIQVLLPFRYVLYPGNLFWTEEGFRFSWRVMLMEKTGTAFFTVCQDGKCVEIDNSDYLTRFQEKMMSTQPDMILQYAHYLRDQFTNKKLGVGSTDFTFTNPEVYVNSFVSLNGRGSRPFIDPKVDLAKQEASWRHKTWILEFKE